MAQTRFDAQLIKPEKINLPGPHLSTDSGYKLTTQPKFQEVSRSPITVNDVPSPTDNVSAVVPTNDRHEGVRELRLSLARIAKQHWSYPQNAVESGWEGIVEVSLVVLRTGQAVFTLRKSSGFELLDTEAMRLLKVSYAQVKLPPALQLQSFELLLPVEFRLAQNHVHH